MRRFASIIVLTALLAVLAAHAELPDTLPVHRNFVSFDPIALLAGGIGWGYERVSGKNGYLAEGGYIFPVLNSKGYDLMLAYRFHPQGSDLGMYLGPFFKFGTTESKLVDQSKSEYRYRFAYSSAGLSIGRRGSLWARHHWLYSIRFGLGYPLRMEWSWDPPPPEKINGVSTDFLKTMTGLSAYLDGACSLCFGF